MSMFGWSVLIYKTRSRPLLTHPSSIRENQDHPPSPPVSSDHSVSDAPPPPSAHHHPPSVALIDPLLRDHRPKHSSLINFDIPPTPTPTPSTNSSSMPHRVDTYPMATQHRRDSYEVSHRRPSPPPITTLNPSPSSSIIQDRSAMSTPPARRTPPQPLSSGLHTTNYYSHEPVMLQTSRHHTIPHFQSRADSMGHSYGFNAHPSFDHRYEHTDGSNHTSYHNSVALPSHASIPPVSHLQNSHVRDAYSHSYPLPGQAPVSIYTDDANTKLSDRVRRRCFNCCTTDTSTWRRSNLSPGKVLCNKCGLFERTHSRPRPEQFPHKRGPLTGTALSRSRTPPTNQLPPISPAYSYSHPSIAPLNNVHDHRREYQIDSLPGLQTWHPSDPGPGPVSHIAPISLPPPSHHHHGQHNGHHHHQHPPTQQGPGQNQPQAQPHQIPTPPMRKGTADSSPDARPASPPAVRPQSASQDARDSPKSVA
ncbi:hypothetical protein AX15_001468 [Amanita polypyramis BW_CC]|nr:hypothetical protein AX15_001468 [Amanita polypyramis BW_CC]